MKHSVDKELDERTFSDRVFQTRAAAIGKARLPTVDSFDVGTANVSDDYDPDHDRYAGASVQTPYHENGNLVVDSLRRPQPVKVT